MPKKLMKDGRIQTTVRLQPELYDRLHRVADERCVGVNLIVSRAIENYLDRLVPLEGK